MFKKSSLISIAFLFLCFASLAGATATNPWFGELAPALDKAQVDDRYVLIDMWADWCGWCHTLEAEVFSSTAFQDFAKDYVLLRVDTVDSAEGSELQKRYFVEKLPTMVIASSKGVLVGSVTGMFSTEEYIGLIRSEIKEYEDRMGYFEKIRDSDRTEIQRKLAQELHERGDGDRAAQLYEKLLAGSGEDPANKAWLNYFLADAYHLAGETQKSRAQLDKARSAASDLGIGEINEKADLLEYYLAQRDGDCDQAKTALENFLDRHPNSSYKSQVRRFLREIKLGVSSVCPS